MRRLYFFYSCLEKPCIWDFRAGKWQPEGTSQNNSNENTKYTSIKFVYFFNENMVSQDSHESNQEKRCICHLYNAWLKSRYTK